jgi:D-alanyl-D-alanine carboxypeptidase/D-alanyl-D-alanine-endopeptidase (penicillin-binding protein 4)
MHNIIKNFIYLHFILVSFHSLGQAPEAKLQKAFAVFQSDAQLQNAIASLYVIDARTSKVVFDKNSTIGLAPASTQKIITTATAYELLGRDFRYKTEWYYNGTIEDGVLNGNLMMKGSGDPTFGSWHYASTKREAILNELKTQLKDKGINKIKGNVYLDESSFAFQPLPGGWMWDDIGNYYGAGSWAINWNENQYDLVLKPGNKEGDTVSIVGMNPQPYGLSLYNQITTGAKGSGDNGYIYLAPYSSFGYTEGTIPLQSNNFTISGSLPYPAGTFSKELGDFLRKNFAFEDSVKVYADKLSNKIDWPQQMQLLYTHYSPSLDSIIYWFDKRSINLYGEALAKTIAYHENGFGSTEKGVGLIKNFWKEKGIATTELNMVDGSGLSPLNRVTTHAQVTILQYAKKQNWFDGFYNALPEYNKMKMKSGTINGVKGFSGYQTSKNGNEYIFSFLVNNYNGSASSLVNKMYRVLDILK